MKKRILSVVLCLAMVSTMLMLPISAAVNLESPAAIADNASMSLIAPNGNNVFVCFDDVTENATVTFYFNPGANYNTSTPPFLFSLCNNATADNRIASLYSAADVDKTVYLNAEGRGIYWWSGYRGATAQPVVLQEWNRVDLQIDFANKQVTGYFNYVKLETVPFLGDFTSFNTLMIHNDKGGYQPNSTCYMDNLIITKGLNDPKKNDVASAVTAEKLAANKANVLHAQTFDAATTTLNLGNSAFSAGNIVTPQTNGGFVSLNASVGMTAADMGVLPSMVPATDTNSGLYVACPPTGGEIRLYVGEITESATITLYYKVPATYKDVANGYTFGVNNTSDTNVTGLSTRFGEGGDYYYMENGSRGGFWNEAYWYAGKQVSKYIDLDKWNRIDIAIDLENQQATGYINYQKLETMSFINETDNISYVTIGSRGNGYQAGQVANFDNLIVTKGVNAPVKGDVASNQSVAVLKAAEKAKTLLALNTFEAGKAPVHTGGDASLITNTDAGAMYITRTGSYNRDMCWVYANYGMTAQTGVAEFRGHQDTTALAGEDFAVRFVGTVVDYKSVYGMGFDLKLNDGTTKEFICSNVYDKLLGSANGVDVEYSALGDFGAGYIYALTLTGLAFDATYDFEVTPFTYDADGVTKIVGETYTVTYVNGVLQ